MTGVLHAKSCAGFLRFVIREASLLHLMLEMCTDTSHLRNHIQVEIERKFLTGSNKTNLPSVFLFSLRIDLVQSRSLRTEVVSWMRTLAFRDRTRILLARPRIPMFQCRFPFHSTQYTTH